MLIATLILEKRLSLHRSRVDIIQPFFLKNILISTTDNWEIKYTHEELVEAQLSFTERGKSNMLGPTHTSLRSAFERHLNGNAITQFLFKNTEKLYKIEMKFCVDYTAERGT